MRVMDSFYIREIAGETIAIPTGNAAQKFSGIIGLNDLGCFLFKCLENDQSEDMLVSAVCEEYEVDPVTARKDIIEFLEQLRNQGILIE